MFEISKTDTIEKLISITKSDSGISGPELAIAHIELGKYLGEQMKDNIDDDTTIVAMLRGGIFFAEGMYFSLKCKFMTFDPKREEYIRPETKKVIIVDSVINTGKTIEKIVDDDTYIACCVINESAVHKFDDKLFTIRVSQNSFVGGNVKMQQGKIGPDTTMRLFNQI